MKDKYKGKTPVIFRTWLKLNSGVIALFPFEPSDPQGNYCLSYEHVGQHGGADPLICRRPYTRPAKPVEAANLVLELQFRGYVLKELSRVPRNARAVRRAKLAEQRQRGKR